jgi:hypothetical protein
MIHGSNGAQGRALCPKAPPQAVELRCRPHPLNTPMTSRGGWGPAALPPTARLAPAQGRALCPKAPPQAVELRSHPLTLNTPMTSAAAGDQPPYRPPQGWPQRKVGRFVPKRRRRPLSSVAALTLNTPMTSRGGWGPDALPPSGPLHLLKRALIKWLPRIHTLCSLLRRQRFENTG